MDKKEQAKLRKRKQRDKEKQNSVTSEGVTLKCDIEMVPASYVQGLNGVMHESLPERPRFITLSDGQVLDRLYKPEGYTNGDRILRMQACNESAYNFHPRKGLEVTK